MTAWRRRQQREEVNSGSPFPADLATQGGYFEPTVNILANSIKG